MMGSMVVVCLGAAADYDSTDDSDSTPQPSRRPAKRSRASLDDDNLNDLVCTESMDMTFEDGGCIFDNARQMHKEMEIAERSCEEEVWEERRFFGADNNDTSDDDEETNRDIDFSLIALHSCISFVCRKAKKTPNMMQVGELASIVINRALRKRRASTTKAQVVSKYPNYIIGCASFLLASKFFFADIEDDMSLTKNLIKEMILNAKGTPMITSSFMMKKLVSMCEFWLFEMCDWNLYSCPTMSGISEEKDLVSLLKEDELLDYHSMLLIAFSSVGRDAKVSTYNIIVNDKRLIMVASIFGAQRKSTSDSIKREKAELAAKSLGLEDFHWGGSSVHEVLALEACDALTANLRSCYYTLSTSPDEISA